MVDVPLPIEHPADFPPIWDAYVHALVQRACIEAFDEIISTVNDVYYPVKTTVDDLLTRGGPCSGGSLKVPLPSFYDGNRADGEAFICAVIIY